MSSAPVDLLLITWNRREYVEKTLPHLLASPSDFRLYCWDNASKDGTAELIASLDDPRVVKRHFSQENLIQRAPTLWFLEEAQSDVVGKIDDDILLPDGWIYMPEDWDEEVAAHKVVEVGGHRVFQNAWIAGQSFLARRDLLRQYVIPPEHYVYGFPIRQEAMTRAGFIHGYPLPILFGHNMDDPRSPHCLMNQPGGMGEQAALTARKRGFQTPKEYGEWIAADAAKLLRTPVREQLRGPFLRGLINGARKKLALRSRVNSALKALGVGRKDASSGA